MGTHNDGATVEGAVLEILKEAGLTRWQQQIIFGLQIRRSEHFSRHTEKEFKELGMIPEEVKRLRASVQRISQSLKEYPMTYVENKNDPSTVSIDPNKTIITKEQIKLMETIGEGTFAVVKRGLWSSPNGRKLDVAVKILRDVSPIVMEDLKIEAGHLLNLEHPHLVQLYGVVQHPAMMVFELCEGGSLLERLRDTSKPVPLLTVLLDYCLQIVKAMSYLQSRHCVHRDLAARNILVTRDEKMVKICDFGLMRNLKENEEMYIMGPQKRVPFSWCPPESLKQRKFSHASDVWAFGVTVWELFTYGDDPWPAMRAIEVLKILDEGKRLEKPTNCSDQIYDIVSLCWHLDPEKRPRFTHLKNLLQQAQFNIAEVRDAHQDTGDKALAIQTGDRIIVTHNLGVIWFGQNERTRKFGTFLRSSVFVHGKGLGGSTPTPASPAAIPSRPLPPLPPQEDPGGNSRITLPIRGSFIHTGHADVRGGHSWGNPATIDDVYIKNPMRGEPMTLGIPTMVNNGTHKPALSPTRTAPPPPAIKKQQQQPPQTLGIRTHQDPLHPDWGDFDAAQSPSFSPSQIRLDSPANNVPVVVPARVAPPVPSHPTTSSSSHSVSPSTSYQTRNVEQHSSARDIWSSSAYSNKTNNFNAKPMGNIVIPTQSGVATVNMPTTSRNQPVGGGMNLTPLNYTPSVLGNGVPKTVNIQPIARPVVSSQDTRRPVINSNNFIQPILPAPNSSYSQRTPDAIKPTTPKPSTTGFDQNVMNELNQRINRTGSTRVEEKPRSASALASSSNMVMMTPSGITLSPARDPFVMDPNTLQTLQRERYRDIMEKRSNALQSKSPDSVIRPHSATGAPFTGSQLPCLIPTPLPVNTRPLSINDTYKAAQQNPITQRPVQQQQQQYQQQQQQLRQQQQQQYQHQQYQHQQQQKAVAHVAPVSAPVESRLPTSSGLRDTTSTPTSSSKSVAQPQAQPEPSRPTQAQPQASVQPQPVRPQSQPSTSSNQPSRPSSNGPDSTPAVTMRPATTVETHSDRISRIEEEIKSLLPAPSALLTGQKAAQLAAITKVSSSPAIPSQPTPPPQVVQHSQQQQQHLQRQQHQAPADPLAISLNSILEPKKLPVNYPAPPPAPVEQIDRRLEINSIMNAYSVSFPSFPPPNYAQAQVPIFALNNSLQNAYPMGTLPYGMPSIPSYGGRGFESMGPSSAFTVGDSPAVMDTRRNANPMTVVLPSSSHNNDAINRANEMEVLYNEASFTDPSRCDEMVSKCKGDIAVALKELKMEYLVDSAIATDKGKAYNALESNGWDLNRAAEVLTG